MKLRLTLLLGLIAVVAFAENVVITNPQTQPVTMRVVGFAKAPTPSGSPVGTATPTATATAGAGLADGDPVSFWMDSAGMGHDASMTGSNRPMFKTAIVNGKPVVRFTTSGASKLDLATLISSVGQFTCYAVMKPAAGSTRLFSLAGDSGGAYGPFDTVAGVNYAQFADRNYHFEFTPMDFSAFHVITARTNPLIQHDLFLDGTSQGISFGAMTNTGDFKTIGYRLDPLYSDGDLAEVIIYQGALAVRAKVILLLTALITTGQIPSEAQLRDAVEPMAAGDRANIEAYLGAKYGITVAGGTATDPGSVAGLVGWWRSDSLSPTIQTGLTDGAPVSGWADSSGKGHIAFATGAARPAFKTGIVGGKPVVRFDSGSGANRQVLSLTGGAISSVSPFCMFVVEKPATPTTSTIVPLTANTGGGHPVGPLSNVDGNIYFSDRSGYRLYANLWGGAFHVYSQVDSAPGTIDLFVDGSNIGSGGIAANPTTGNFDQIGSINSTGDIAEIVIVSGAISTTDRQNVEKTLSVKYGTASPPAGSVIDLATLPGLQGWWKADSLGP